MSEAKKCPQCGAELKSAAPEGLCPACLLQRGVPTEPIAEQNQKPFVPPPLTELAALFPQLEILDLIGKGGMGAVYKARQKQLDRIVALKILPPGIGNDPAFAERFAREAKALAKLNHPGIVTLYEFGETNGQFYFLMEFVDGVNLRQLLNAGRISPREALAIVPQICDALQFAHDQGIVHRDIKPENILLDRRGRVKVADFGLAKIVVGQESRLSDAVNELPESKDRQDACPTILTDAGKIMGTPNYMSPEQKENPGEVDHRADIYALGVVFYQMLTGELPGKKIEPPSKKVQIDVRLDEIVLRALEKKPELRYQQVSVLKTQVEIISAISSDKNEPKQKSRAHLWFISPLSSPEVRDIAAHLTKAERSEFSFYGFLLGAWVCLATFGNFFLIKFYPSPGNWILPVLIISIFIASLPPMLRMQKRFLCSTAWAKKQNYSADQIKLVSFSWLNFRHLLIFVVIVALLFFAKNKMFLHFSGVSELTASLKETETRTKKLSAELANQSKSFYIGQAYFPKGDSIKITSVERNKNQMTVKGRYNLVSHDEALLALYVTTESRRSRGDEAQIENTKNNQRLLTSSPTDHRNEIKISKGRGDFELVDPNWVPGLPHISMYAGGHPFASVYFGNKSEAAEESKAGWITIPKFGERLVPIMKPGAAKNISTSTRFQPPSAPVTKEIILARATNQLVGTSDVIRTVTVWTETMIQPGEILSAVVRFGDGQLIDLNSTSFINWEPDRVGISSAFIWWFGRLNFSQNFDQTEAEAAVAQLRNLDEKPLTLISDKPLELFSVTNKSGEIMIGYLKFQRIVPTLRADSANEKIQAIVHIRKFETFSPTIYYDAKLPPGYALRATANQGRVFTEIAKMPRTIGDYRSAWSDTFMPKRVFRKPGQAPLLSSLPRVYTPAEREAQSAVLEVQLQELQDQGPIPVVLGKPKLLFSTTNEAGEIYQGFLELAGPQASRSADDTIQTTPKHE